MKIKLNNRKRFLSYHKWKIGIVLVVPLDIKLVLLLKLTTGIEKPFITIYCSSPYHIIVFTFNVSLSNVL